VRVSLKIRLESLDEDPNDTLQPPRVPNFEVHASSVMLEPGI
jgi:hypothetical protein